MINRIYRAYHDLKRVRIYFIDAGGDEMATARHGKVRAQCYPAVKSTALTILGIALIAVGVLLVFLCVPYWAWLAAIGALLIALGILLVKK